MNWWRRSSILGCKIQFSGRGPAALSDPFPSRSGDCAGMRRARQFAGRVHHAHLPVVRTSRSMRPFRHDRSASHAGALGDMFGGVLQVCQSPYSIHQVYHRRMIDLFRQDDLNLHPSLRHRVCASCWQWPHRGLRHIRSRRPSFSSSCPSFLSDSSSSSSAQLGQVASISGRSVKISSSGFFFNFFFRDARQQHGSFFLRTLRRFAVQPVSCCSGFSRDFCRQLRQSPRQELQQRVQQRVLVRGR